MFTDIMVLGLQNINGPVEFLSSFKTSVVIHLSCRFSIQYTIIVYLNRLVCLSTEM